MAGVRCRWEGGLQRGVLSWEIESRIRNAMLKLRTKSSGILGNPLEIRRRSRTKSRGLEHSSEWIISLRITQVLEDAYSSSEDLDLPQESKQTNANRCKPFLCSQVLGQTEMAASESSSGCLQTGAAVCCYRESRRE